MSVAVKLAPVGSPLNHFMYLLLSGVVTARRSWSALPLNMASAMSKSTSRKRNR